MLPIVCFVAVLMHSQCSQSDLICCALVSQHFRELASAILYRSFNILFPDDDDVRFESPIDGLAGGLDTFTTSDYNYAKHLRELSMDTVSTGVKAEHAYKPYLYSASCGKFLNTLLYLTLKKAKSLESFRLVPWRAVCLYSYPSSLTLPIDGTSGLNLVDLSIVSFTRFQR